jgi:lysophospholipase L1-like esterase
VSNYISKFLIFSIGVFLLAFLAPSTSYAAWGHSRPITIDHTKVQSSTQTNFPVLISGTYAYLKTTANGGDVENASGYDIVFYSDQALTTPLKFEIESWSATTGAINAWVKIPSLSHTVDTVIYMAYGDASVSSDQSDPENVWDSNFNNVWHFKNPSSPDLTDSTAQSWDMTNNGLTGTTGKISGGVAANGSTQYATLSSKSLASSTVTISGWFKRNWASHAYIPILTWEYDSFTGIGLYIDVLSGSDWVSGDVLMVGDGYYVDNDPRAIASLGTLTNDTWHHISATVGSSVSRVYLDGDLLSMRISETAPIQTITSQNINIFRDPFTARYDGTADEMRLSTTARSADWVKTEYNNQSSPSTFYSIGEEDEEDATTYTFIGPSTSTLSVASSDFTVTPNGAYTGTITPSDGGAGGTFTPTSLTFSNESTGKTFTYTAASLGAKTISTSSSPALDDPSSIALTVTSPTAGVVAVDDANLVWSPYNWRFNGSTWAQTTPGGAYVKVAFTGSTLSLGIDTSVNTGVPLSSIKLDAYIDGSTSAIQRNLSQVSSGILNFSSALSGGSHYAIIYLSQTSVDYDRWNDPVVNGVRITKIQLANDGSGNVGSLSSTPLAEKARKFLIYGDSIVEGYLDSVAEKSYAAVMGQALSGEYAQVGYGCLGWTYACQGGLPFFYAATPANSSWRKLDSATSRLNTNSTPSSGFVDGSPDAVFLDIGTNDAYFSTSTSTMRTKVAAWLSEIRAAIGSTKPVFVISPFMFGNATHAAYKTALLGGVSDYLTANPSDTRVYTIDLGSGGYATVVDNSVDDLHPDDTGAAILGAQLADLAGPDIAIFSTSPSSIVQNSTGNSITLTGINTLWTAGTPGTPTFQLSGGTGASITAQTINSATSATLTISAGSATGTLTITDPTYDSTATITVTAPVDSTAPVISSVSATASDTGATITWTTDEASSSIVNYGTTSGYGTATTEADTSPRVTSHSVILSGLSTCTLYHYQVSSKDASANTGTGSDSTFTTSGCDSNTTDSNPSRVTRNRDDAPIQQDTENTPNPPITPTTPTTTTGVLTRSIPFYSRSAEVYSLQKYLNAKGFFVSRVGPGSPGSETTLFGPRTKQALIKFQEFHANEILAPLGLTKGTGIIGPMTRAYINAHP